MATPKDADDLRRILSAKHGPAMADDAMDGIARAAIRWPFNPFAPTMGAVVGAIAGALKRRHEPDDLLQVAGLRMVLATSVDDLSVDDDPDQATRDVVTAMVDRAIERTEVLTFGATADIPKSLSVADIRLALDKVRSMLPPWHDFRNQVTVEPSPWIAGDHGAYVIDTTAIEWWVDPEDEGRRYRVLVRPDVLAALEAAGATREDIGAMIVWKVRNDYVATHGPEAWPMDDLPPGPITNQGIFRTDIS